jgi:hypothetical protein
MNSAVFAYFALQAGALRRISLHRIEVSLTLGWWLASYFANPNPLKITP